MAKTYKYHRPGLFFVSGDASPRRPRAAMFVVPSGSLGSLFLDGATVLITQPLSLCPGSPGSFVFPPYRQVGMKDFCVSVTVLWGRFLIINSWYQ